MLRRSHLRGRLINSGIFLVGCGVGAFTMYLLDPGRGTRRRAQIRDKFIRAGHVIADRADKQARNLANHVKGAIYEVRARLRSERVPDEVLIERVRAQLGHTVSHPAALEVRVNDGRVTVSGPVLSGERKKIEDRLHETRGVCDLALQVMEYESREGVQGLQGEPRRKHERKIVGI
jgi:osmotically-inducible protein OsmY